ncbi:hypothetical protein ACFOY2_05085 [Nonomuraea purpurea]|uniref:Uncharacterized protein n=1 Tax=Nonomuraea purpurea TaxID=1849276 RepID=A0ABV8G2Y4_9ACTN
MIGSKYWSTGITVRYSNGAWGGTVEYLDDGFANDDAATRRISTEGELRTRYFVKDCEGADALTVVIDVLISDAERLGITWNAKAGVYYHGDGEDSDWPTPDGWRGLVNAQSVRLGWETKYVVSDSSTPEEG